MQKAWLSVLKTSSFPLEFILVKNLSKAEKQSKFFSVRVEHIICLLFNLKLSAQSKPKVRETSDFQTCLNLLQYLEPTMQGKY